MKEKKKFLIEISVSFSGEMPEHEGYYNSPDEAKEAIDQLYELFENELDKEGLEPETFCTHFVEDIYVPRCLNFIEGGYCRHKTC